MSFGLLAPAAVPVELRASRRRVFRLSHEVGEQGIRLAGLAPFEVGEPVELRLVLPDTTQPLALRAEVELVGDEREEGGRGGCGLRFIEPPHELRQALAGYVSQRLGLPRRLDHGQPARHRRRHRPPGSSLERRADEGGGAERKARQHQAGKLTARERVDCCSIRAPSSRSTSSSPTAAPTSGWTSR